MLEQHIQDLTEAVKALTAVLLNPIPVPQVVTLEKPEEKPVSIVVEDLPVDVKQEESEPAATYDAVKNIVIAVSKVSKAKAVAALGRFGVKTAKELNECQWADFVAYMIKVQSGDIDPEASE